METFNDKLKDTREWALDRIVELCSRGDFEEVVNGDSIRQEFDEWIMSENKQSVEEVISMAYIGEGSEYDI